jgi:U3 small nucleolar RNA-associated protein 6
LRLIDNRLPILNHFRRQNEIAFDLYLNRDFRTCAGIARLPVKIEHHFSRRTNTIFSRMLLKFGSDVTLWLQYIEYLKKTRNVPTLNRVFAQYPPPPLFLLFRRFVFAPPHNLFLPHPRAIQLHPTNEGLWIVAAGYEFENNENITAARCSLCLPPSHQHTVCLSPYVWLPPLSLSPALMERALRLLPKSERLWVEFCKLEYIYLARIKERMTEYGIDKSALVPKVTS